MTVNFLARLKKNKKRRILVISAGGMQGGIQTIYFGIKEPFEVYSSAFMPYPQKINGLIEHFTDNQAGIPSFEDLGHLDYKLSQLYVECAETALAQVPRGLRTPHLIVLNKLNLWKGPTGEIVQQSIWNLSAGDEQYVASSMDVPVVTDFIRQNILAGGPGITPTLTGNQIIASKCSGIAVMLNIGIISRMTVIDCATSSALIDSDTGPGTSLIDRVAREVCVPEGFDRDGTLALQGKVDGECLDKLASSPWFRQPAPKYASRDLFKDLLRDPCLGKLDDKGKLATISALTAKTIYDFYRREYKSFISPDKIWISGGGIHNQALMEYLKTYFDPISITSVEELGIPVDMRVPLSLGLTVNALIDGRSIPWETGNSPKINSPGRWVFP